MQVRIYTREGHERNLDADSTKIPYESIFGHRMDVSFLLYRGKIPKTRGRRKGVWTPIESDRHYIYFVCPWCKKINKVEKAYVGMKNCSVYCMARDCRLHLFVSFIDKPFPKEDKKCSSPKT